MPEIQIDPTTGEITNRGEVVDALIKMTLIIIQS